MFKIEISQFFVTDKDWITASRRPSLKSVHDQIFIRILFILFLFLLEVLYSLVPEKDINYRFTFKIHLCHFSDW